MIDVALVWDNESGTADFAVSNNDLTQDSGLKTAVYMSLYTDQRAAVDDPVDDPDDRRGWWGDTLEADGDQIGSRIWLYSRQKITTNVLSKIQEAIEDSLQWMIDDGVAAEISVIVERNELDRIYTEIKIYRESGSTVTVKYDDLWNAMEAE